MSRLPVVTQDWRDVCVIGDERVGKTAFAQLLSEGWYDTEAEYEPTLEDTYIVHVTSTLYDKMKLKLIDTSGRLSHRGIPQHYLELCEGFIVMYSIICPESFDTAKRLVKEIVSARKEDDYTIVVLGNKFDLIEQRSVSRFELEYFCVQEKVIYDEVTVTNKNTFLPAMSQLVDDIFRRTVEESDRELLRRRGVVHKLADLF